MEGGILIALQGARFDVLTQLFALVSALGAGSIIWVVAALFLLFFEELRSSGVILFVVLIITSVVTALLAAIFARECPTEAVQGLVGVVGVSKDGYCFPSIYASTSFAAAFVIAKSTGKGPGLAAIVMAVLIGFSRVFLGVSYPTDILAGAILGLALAFVSFTVLAKAISLIDAQPKKPPQRKRVSRARGNHSRY